MPTVTLYIRNQLADVFSAERLAPRIYKRLFDLENLGSRRGDKAINLKLPRTSNNSRLLGYIDSVETAGNFFANRSYEAAIWADGAQLLAGRLFIDQITPDAFECSLVGGNIAWADSLRGIRAQDLPLRCVAYSGAHSTAVAPILDFASQNTVSLYEIWQDGVEGGTYDFAMPLLGYGNFPCEPGNTDTNPINGVQTIEESAGVVDGAVLDNSAANPLSVFDFVPAPYLRAVLRAAAEAAGYVAKGDVFSDPFFEGICLPCTLQRTDIDAAFNFGILGQGKINYNLNDNPILPNVWTGASNLLNTWTLNDGGYILGIINQESDDPRQDFQPTFTDTAVGQSLNLGFFDLVQTPIGPVGIARILALADGVHRLRFTASGNIQGVVGTRYAVGLYAFTPDTLSDFKDGLGPGDAALQDYIINGNALVVGGNLLAATTYTYTGPGLQAITVDVVAEVNIPAGTLVVPIWAVENTPLVSALVLQETVLAMESPQSTDSLLCPARFLPDESAADLVRAIIEHFNLYVSVEERSNTLYFNTRETYFFGNELAYDWNDKCSSKVLTARAPEWYRRIDLKYQEEDNEPLFTAGEFDAVWLNESKYYTDELERESFFAATGLRRFVLYKQDAEIGLNSLGDVDEYAKKLGELSTGEQTRTYEWVPRIVRYMGLAQDSPGPNATETAIWIDDLAIRATYDGGTTFSGPLILPYTRFDTANTLSYADRSGGRRGLFTRYFEREFEQVAASVVIRLPVMLTSADVLDLDVRKPVLINQIYYIVNEVEGFNPGDQTPTTVTLIRK